MSKMLIFTTFFDSLIPSAAEYRRSQKKTNTIKENISQEFRQHKTDVIEWYNQSINLHSGSFLAFDSP